MKQSINKIIPTTFIIILLFSCNKDFLEINPNGSISADILATEEGVNSLLIGAYSMIDGVSSQGFGWEAASSNWVFGSIRGMEANKGSDAEIKQTLFRFSTILKLPPIYLFISNGDLYMKESHGVIK